MISDHYGIINQNSVTEEYLDSIWSIWRLYETLIIIHISNKKSQGKLENILNSLKMKSLLVITCS